MQPTPKSNNTQPIHEQVIEDIKLRAEAGKQNYGTYLQANNGRDSLLDAYEEAQDKALYLKQAILERDDLVMELEAAREKVRRLTQANGGIRKERDRAVAEARRDGARKQFLCQQGCYMAHDKDGESCWLIWPYGKDGDGQPETQSGMYDSHDAAIDAAMTEAK